MECCARACSTTGPRVRKKAGKMAYLLDGVWGHKGHEANAPVPLLAVVLGHVGIGQLAVGLEV